MKLLIFFGLLFLACKSYSQCVDCTDMKSALVQPEIVKNLDLRAKGLTRIPVEIAEFINLKKLNLSDNFILEIDFNTFILPELESFIINNNPGFLTIHLPHIHKALPNLRSMEMTGDRIKFLSSEIANLTKLESLNLENNAISFLPEEINKLPNLKFLNLKNNNLLSQEYMFSGFWKLKELDVSDNDSINLAKMLRSLLLKDDLRKLTITIRDFSTLTKDLNEVPIEILSIVNSKGLTLPGSIRNDKHIAKIIFDNSSFKNPALIYDILNSTPNLKIVEFRNMNVPAGISAIKNLNELHLQDAILEGSQDLKDMSAKTKVYQNNVSLVDHSRPTIVSNRKCYDLNVSDEMLFNDSPCLKDAEVFSTAINSDISEEINLDNSKYIIPENAFLNQDGSVYVGSVNIEIKEYFDPIMNALAGMPMMYDENGSSMLFSSNGMIEFNAKDIDGKNLIPDPKNLIQVELKDLQPSKNSDLYVFDKTTSNWNKIGLPRSSNIDSLRGAQVDSINQLSSNDIVSTKTISPLIAMDIKTKRMDPSVFSYRIYRPNEREKRNAPINHFYLNEFAECDIAKQRWEVDTLLSKELRNLFSDIRTSQRLVLKYMRKGKSLSSNGVPRIITNMKITPDFAKDNFRLTFNFKGDSINLPVTQLIHGNANRVQDRESKEYVEYVRNCKKDNKEENKVIGRKNKYIENMAPLYRAQMLNALRTNVFINTTAPTDNQDVLRFGLSSFGIINCDYFFRNKPDDYLALNKNIMDQFDSLVEIPKVVTNIFLENNVFISTYSESIPYFKDQSNIIFFPIGTNEIAVLRTIVAKKESDSDSEEIQVLCKRFDITTLSAAQIRLKILEI